MKREDITTDTKIQKIRRTCLTSLYSTKFEKSKEMDKILHVYVLPKSNQDEKNILNSLITCSKLVLIKTSQLKKSPGSDVFNTISPSQKSSVLVLLFILFYLGFLCFYLPSNRPPTHTRQERKVREGKGATYVSSLLLVGQGCWVLWRSTDIQHSSKPATADTTEI